MQAWILKKQAKIESRPLEWVELPTPHAQEGEIRVKVIVCGVCRTDIHIVEGDLALKKSPVVLGHEIVGIVDELGKHTQRFRLGEKVGAYWLHSTCGQCKHCLDQRENYCLEFKATGWHEDGGFAEYITIPEQNAVSLDGIPLEPAEIAPLLCPGVAGYAAFRLSKVQKGDKLGLYGFGPTAHCVLKVAQAMGVDSYVSTRSKKNFDRAKMEGAIWVGDAAKEALPCKLDSTIIFPPAGNLVEPALSQVNNGGCVVMAPVSSSQIRIEDYSNNFWGRALKTLYHVTKSDAERFFAVVREIEPKIRMGVSVFPFESLQNALIQVKHGDLDQPNAVIQVTEVAQQP
jgi:propanol-preferring alcohol dehydrogenase